MKRGITLTLIASLTVMIVAAIYAAESHEADLHPKGGMSSMMSNSDSNGMGMMGRMMSGGHKGMNMDMMGDMMRQCMSMMSGGMTGAMTTAVGSTPATILTHSDRLDLTDSQLASLRELTSTLKKETISLNAKRQTAQVDLDALIESEAPLDVIEAKSLEAAKAHIALRIAHLRASREAAALLTAEQRETLTSATPARQDGYVFPNEDAGINPNDHAAHH